VSEVIFQFTLTSFLQNRYLCVVFKSSRLEHSAPSFRLLPQMRRRCKMGSPIVTGWWRRRDFTSLFSPDRKPCWRETRWYWCAMVLIFIAHFTSLTAQVHIIFYQKSTNTSWVVNLEGIFIFRTNRIIRKSIIVETKIENMNPSMEIFARKMIYCKIIMLFWHHDTYADLNMC